MKLLTDSEREARDIAWANFYTDPADSDFDSFATGFNAAIDHLAAELAALQAERDDLRAALQRTQDERGRLRDVLTDLLYVFDHGYTNADTLGKMRHGQAQQVLEETK